MRWQPSSEQIALAIDCAVARVPLESAAELLGVKPRTLRSFLKRIMVARAQKAISGGLAAKTTTGMVHSGIPAIGEGAKP